MAIFSPRIRLKRVDFPTFGLPRMEMKPDLKGAIIRCKRSQSKEFGVFISYFEVLKLALFMSPNSGLQTLKVYAERVRFNTSSMCSTKIRFISLLI
jgi:hypothetical protein